MKKAKYIKFVDLPKSMIIEIFKKLNYRYVEIQENVWDSLNPKVIVTKVSPKTLIYPEGWYFAKGALRNKGNSSSGAYEEIPIITPDGRRWTGSVLCEEMEQKIIF